MNSLLNKGSINLQLLNAITVTRKLSTGSRPLVVITEDFNDYICKYTSNAYHKNLIKEIIAYYFLKAWNIRCPDCALLKVDKNYIPHEFLDNFTKAMFFKSLCFGSKYLKSALMVDDFLSTSDSKTIRKIKNQNDLLKLSLFDIWTSNEDRNHNNYNLITNPEPDGYYFYAIDNECIFNNGFLDHDLYEITEDESLLFTDVTKKIFKTKRNKIELLNSLILDYFKCIENCKLILKIIVDNIPNEWGLNKSLFLSNLETKLFSKTWIETVKKTFKLYFVKALIK